MELCTINFPTFRTECVNTQLLSRIKLMPGLVVNNAEERGKKKKHTNDDQKDKKKSFGHSWGRKM